MTLADSAASRRFLGIALLGLCSATLTACNDDPSGPAGPIPVSLRFEARVGDAVLACGQSHNGIGTTGSTIRLADLRLYVHDVRLVTSAGEEVAVTLDQDGTWQLENLALLDFEDGTADCGNGTPQTRLEVTGTAPAGDYDGVRFRIGVPFELNHGDQTIAPSPLNLSSLFWAWNFGYIFMRLDVVTTGQPGGYFAHLGSSGCTPNDDFAAPPANCANPNRAEISLSSFDHQQDAVVLDIGQYLAGSNVDATQDGGGCHSGPDDTDCAPLFERVGLPFTGQSTASQVAFRVGQ